MWDWTVLCRMSVQHTEANQSGEGHITESTRLEKRRQQSSALQGSLLYLKKKKKRHEIQVPNILLFNGKQQNNRLLRKPSSVAPPYTGFVTSLPYCSSTSRAAKIKNAVMLFSTNSYYNSYLSNKHTKAAYVLCWTHRSAQFLRVARRQRSL